MYLHYGDLTDATNLIRIIQQPDEICNLAAQSHVAVSFETPEYTANSDAPGTLRILEAIRILGLQSKTRFYQASTSEMFGQAQEIQRETTPFYPRSPYGASQGVSPLDLSELSRGLRTFRLQGDSVQSREPIRGETFVTRKITRGWLASMRGWRAGLTPGLGSRPRLRERAVAHIAATGARGFCDCHRRAAFGPRVRVACRELPGMAIDWRGRGADEQGVDANRGRVVVRIDPRYVPPDGGGYAAGGPSKAKAKLGWQQEIGFEAPRW